MQVGDSMDSRWPIMATGDKKNADAVLAQVIEEQQNDSAVQIAEIYAHRGERDKAFEWLISLMFLARLPNGSLIEAANQFIRSNQRTIVMGSKGHNRSIGRIPMFPFEFQISDPLIFCDRNNF